jgi:hypothetical protein
MLRAQVEDGRENERGLASQLMIPFDARHEPELPFKTAWVQSIENQSALLEAFFGALEPQTSLCFFYAKRTPLSEDHRRVIIGVGRVVGVGEPVEYEYATKAPPLRGMLWERNVRHSIRPTLEDGFLFPYAEVRAAAAQNPSIDVSACVAFAPDEYFDSYSYGSRAPGERRSHRLFGRLRRGPREDRGCRARPLGQGADLDRRGAEPAVEGSRPLPRARRRAHRVRPGAR